MPIKNTPDVYGWVSVVVHWLSALVFFGLFALGLWMTSLDYYHPWYKQGPDLHRSLGVLLVALSLGRWCWQWLNPRPHLAMPNWQRRLAVGVQQLFYLLFVLMLLSGYAITTAKGQPLEVFNWFSIPALLPEIAQLEDIAGEVHEWLAYGFVALVALHAGAAFKHHFINKDNTLLMMLGRTKQSKQP